MIIIRLERHDQMHLQTHPMPSKIRRVIIIKLIARGYFIAFNVFSYQLLNFYFFESKLKDYSKNNL
jgi:hypothetical protein